MQRGRKHSGIRRPFLSVCVQRGMEMRGGGLACLKKRGFALWLDGVGGASQGRRHGLTWHAQGVVMPGPATMSRGFR